MIRIAILLCVIVSVAGCGRLGLDRIGAGATGAGAKRNTATIDNVRYRSQVSVDSEDKRDFTITVTPVGNVVNAQEAGRYQSTLYCLRTFGGSDTEWIAGPDVEPQDAQISDNSLKLKGRCTQR